MIAHSPPYCGQSVIGVTQTFSRAKVPHVGCVKLCLPILSPGLLCFYAVSSLVNPSQPRMHPTLQTDTSTGEDRMSSLILHKNPVYFSRNPPIPNIGFFPIAYTTKDWIPPSWSENKWGQLFFRGDFTYNTVRRVFWELGEALSANHKPRGDLRAISSAVPPHLLLGAIELGSLIWCVSSASRHWQASSLLSRSNWNIFWASLNFQRFMPYRKTRIRIYLISCHKTKKFHLLGNLFLFASICLDEYQRKTLQLAYPQEYYW